MHPFRRAYKQVSEVGPQERTKLGRPGSSKSREHQLWCVLALGVLASRVIQLSDYELARIPGASR